MQEQETREQRVERATREGKTPYIVGVYKVSNPDVYRAVANPLDFYEIQSETKAVGDEAVYGQWLTSEQRDVFQQVVDDPTGNGRYLEEDVLDSIPQDDEDPEAQAVTQDDSAGSLYQGADYNALQLLGFLASEYQYRGQNVMMGVGDSGTYAQHEYIQPRLLQHLDYVGDYGRFDGVDHNGHGAWCTGAALAPDSRLVNGKVLNKDGSGYRSHVVAFWRDFSDLCYAARQPGVLSLSLGGPGTSTAYDDASRYSISKKVITVGAAGNSGVSPVMTPAIEYGVIGVAATNLQRVRASFSNYSPGVHVAGPGVSLNGLSGYLTGTSMATPLIARMVAYLYSLNPRSGDVRRALYGSANRAGNESQYVGHGIPELQKAMKLVAA